MNKSQIEAVQKTLTNRVINHYKSKSEKIEETIKPSTEAKALLNKFNKVADEVEKFNEKIEKSNQLDFKINIPGFNNHHATLQKTGYSSNISTTKINYVAIVPELADELRTKLTKIEDYVLALTLGKENLDELDNFIKKLLS